MVSTGASEGLIAGLPGCRGHSLQRAVRLVDEGLDRNRAGIATLEQGLEHRAEEVTPLAGGAAVAVVHLDVGYLAGRQPARDQLGHRLVLR